MIEERREEIERSIERFKSYRKCRVDFYLKWDGVIPDDQLLPEIKKDIEWAEESIMKLREQLPPPMSQRQLRALEEIPKAWAEVTGKKIGKEFALPDEARKLLDEANGVLNSDERHMYRAELDVVERKLNEAHKIIKQRFDEAHEEALCEAADKTLQEYADIAAGRDFTIHHSGSGDKRFEGALPDDPATKQRKSLGRAIIDLLNTKYK